MENSLTVQQHGGGIIMDDDDDRSRTIRGRRVVFLDGVWFDSAENPLPSDLRVLVYTATTIYRVWLHGECIEEIIKTPGVILPDPEERNKEIPESEWDVSKHNGQKRKPASISQLIYAVAADGEEFTFISNTKGAGIAVPELARKIRNTRNWHNDQSLCPIIGFSTTSMPTRHGRVVPRPLFTTHGYRSFGAQPQTPAVKHTPADNTPAEQTVQEPSLTDQMKDSVDF